jgi:hypothetical protein
MRYFLSFWFLLLIAFVKVSPGSPVGDAESGQRFCLPSAFQQDESWSRSSSTSVLSDFDGDGAVDLAVSRFDGHGYNIDILLSAERSSTLSASGHIEPGFCLLARDVDLDNDEDLVLVNYTSLLPMAIWLNDGKARFQQSDRWSWLNLITTDHTCSANSKSLYGSPISLSENDRFPLNRPVTAFFAEKLPPRNSIACQCHNPCSLVFLSQPSLRGPPLSS